MGSTISRGLLYPGEMRFLSLLLFAALTSCAPSLTRVNEKVSACCERDNATCNPKGECYACKNCKYCKHCNAGGTCSVCR
jgi:hypothetical protein